MLCQRKTKTERPVLPSADTGPETSERCSPARADRQHKPSPLHIGNHETQDTRPVDPGTGMIISGYADACHEKSVTNHSDVMEGDAMKCEENYPYRHLHDNCLQNNRMTD